MTRAGVQLSLLAWMMLLAIPAASAASFLPYQATALGGSPVSVAVGDVTGDGLDDVVLTTSTNDFLLYVFAQRQDGTLAAPRLASFRASSMESSSSVVLGDWDGDGIKDIVVGHALGVTVFLGGKPLTPHFYRSIFSHGELVGIADVNHDGALDIISQGGAVPWVSIYEGDGSGGVRRMVYAQVRGGYDMEVADLNHDGFADIAGTSEKSESSLLSIAYNSGAADPPPVVFTPKRGAPIRREVPDLRYSTLPVQVYPGYTPVGLGVGDFNHDGLLDVGTADWRNSPNGAISLFLQQANGRLGLPQRLASYDLPGTMLGADINGDGRDDLLVLHDAAQAAGYYLQDTSGMQNEVLLPLPYGNRYPRRGLAVGDVNHDGFSDIVLVTDMAGLVILYGAP